MSTNPFDSVIAQAEQRETEMAEQRKSENLLRKEQAAVKALKQRQQKICNFARGFLRAVATRVVDPNWSSDYIRKIQEYAEALVSLKDKELPKISQHHAEQILEKFRYGLTLPHNRGVVPDDYLFGQRLLKQQTEQQPKETRPRINYVPDLRVVHTSRSTNTPDKVVDFKPATTPKKKGGKGTYRRKKAAASAASAS